MWLPSVTGEDQHTMQGLNTLTSSKLLWLQYTRLNTLAIRLYILDFLAIKSFIQVLCWDSLPFCDKWIYYFLQERRWRSEVVWTTAVINDNMNLADTLYWLQIVTTTSSKHSSNNSLFLSLQNSFFFSFCSHLFLQYWPPTCKTRHVSLIIFALQNIILHPPKLGQPQHHITTWQSLSSFECITLMNEVICTCETTVWPYND